MFRPFGPGQMGFATFDRRGAVPVNNSHASPSISDDLPGCPPGGVTFCATDFPCRVAFIIVSSEKPITKNGEALEETVLKT
ncbi:Uncharacterized protein HZ326_7329 [Fusarium oxysporum f. sp. albedinis]|nr:Uncharacterized protein HZ326_7329 [Fusarium oxysporum f. sp. albedinis]